MFAVVGPTGNRAADWLIALSLVLAAFSVIWAKALRPLVRGARLLDQVLPTLIDIGQQFHENGGHTLKDSLNRIEGQLKAGSEERAEQGDKLDKLHQYAHDENHERRNDIAKLVLADESLLRNLAELSDHMSPVPAKLDAIAVAAGAADDAAIEHREAHPDNRGE